MLQQMKQKKRLNKAFYERFEETIRKCSLEDVIILMGDINAKVERNTSYEGIMGKHGLGTINENGEMFANISAENNLAISGTIFPHKPCHLATLVSPDKRTKNQIDHICIARRFRRSLQDVRVKRLCSFSFRPPPATCKCET